MKTNGDSCSQRSCKDQANMESVAAMEIMASLPVCNELWMRLPCSTASRNEHVPGGPVQASVPEDEPRQEVVDSNTLCRQSRAVFCMQIITRRKTTDIPPVCLLHDVVYQDHTEKKVQIGAIF